MSELPVAAEVIARTILETLESPAWVCAVNDTDARIWLLTTRICDALYMAGIERIPSRVAVEAAVKRYQRNMQIVKEFNGHNYKELAVQCRISTRSVRRIIERSRQARTKQVPLTTEGAGIE